MSLVTGTPLGGSTSQEEIYLDGAPNIYLQDYLADPLNNPDGDGYYWGMSGTTAYPYIGLACVTDVTFMQGVTANDIRCDADGVKGTIQTRDYVDFAFTTKNLFPLSIYTKLAGFSTATVGTGTEKVGIGGFNNNQYYMVYAPKVYNEDTGDYLLIHLHKAQPVEPAELAMLYGDSWSQSFVLRSYADSTKPSTQRFGVIIRSDASALP